MSEKYKLGLSRNRLFQFNSTVVFCGELKGEVNQAEAHKSLKMLANKVPVISSTIELEPKTDDAYLVTGSFAPEIVFSHLTAKEIVEEYQKNPICFYNRIFEFSFSTDGYLVIAGHTVFCDSKSLLRLAKYFAGFYFKTSLGVEPEPVYTFPDMKSLPVDVVSPLVNKLSSELDDAWQKNVKSYSVDDYREARDKYLGAMPVVAECKIHLSSEEVRDIREKAYASEVDFYSVICFAFYKGIHDTVKLEKKSSKIRVSADRRFFHGGKKLYSVGAYNGTVTIHLTDKEQRKSKEEQLKLFHADLYRALTSPFRVFSDEILLYNVQKNYCDSAHMYIAGENKFKASKNLAENYGCKNEELCEFSYCNLTQQFWQGMASYSNVTVAEPFVPARSRFNASVCESEDGCNCLLQYDTSRVTEEQVREICEKVKITLSDF